MIPLNDERWAELVGGYGISYDARPALRKVIEPASSAAGWDEIWSELHHQGDIGSASMAVVPHLAASLGGVPPTDWNLFNFVGTIEQIRLEKAISIPDWLTDSYPNALQQLNELAFRSLDDSNLPELTQSALGLLAIGAGQVTAGRLLLSFGRDELEEMERLYLES